MTGLCWDDMHWTLCRLWVRRSLNGMLERMDAGDAGGEERHRSRDLSCPYKVMMSFFTPQPPPEGSIRLVNVPPKKQPSIPKSPQPSTEVHQVQLAKGQCV